MEVCASFVNSLTTIKRQQCSYCMKPFMPNISSTHLHYASQLTEKLNLRKNAQKQTIRNGSTNSGGILIVKKTLVAIWDHVPLQSKQLSYINCMYSPDQAETCDHAILLSIMTVTLYSNFTKQRMGRSESCFVLAMTFV